MLRFLYLDLSLLRKITSKDTGRKKNIIALN
jgi:hypothetical protein